MSADEALHSEQFKMQTNIGAKPGSQGTLFQGGYPKNWPRGYSPERRDEVKGALGWSGWRLRGNNGRPSGHQGGGTAADTHVMFNNLARSTVPVEHLHDVDIHAGQATLARVEENTRGVYRHPYDTARSGSMSDLAGQSRDVHHPGEIAILKGASAGLTPIHEVGHHVSYTVDKTEHAPYDTPERRGSEEGYAENYAETHFRDRRGRQQRSTNTSLGWERGESDATAAFKFRLAFDAKRRQSPLAPGQFDHTRMTKKQQGLPSEHIAGQTALIDKTGGGEYVQHPETGEWQPKPGPRDWDYTYEDRERGLKRERG